MSALLVFAQALVMGGCICLGMFTSATVECHMPVVTVPLPAAQQLDEPCDAEERDQQLPS